MTGLLVRTLAASTLLFAVLAVSVTSGDAIVSLDREIVAWLHTHATAPATDVLRVVTQLGGATVLLAITVAAATVLLVRRRIAHTGLMGAALAGSEGLNMALKAAFERPRPSLSDPLATAAGFSFPSGHAMVALTVYGALAFVIAGSLSSRRGRILAVAAAASLVLMIGFSRVYLGVHYPSDVLAAYGAGLAWLMACGLLLLGGYRRLIRSAHVFRLRVSFSSTALVPPRIATRRSLR